MERGVPDVFIAMQRCDRGVEPILGKLLAAANDLWRIAPPEVQRFSAAVATSREGYRSPRSGRADQRVLRISVCLSLCLISNCEEHLRTIAPQAS
jgi:hypothetical protein